MKTGVLIAESNAFLSEVLSGTLTGMGFTVVGTTSKPAEIAPLVRETRPDLLLLDYHLAENGLSGLPEYQRLKTEFPGMKILVLGLHEETGGLAGAILEAGFDGFFSKWKILPGLTKTLDLLFPGLPAGK